MESNEQKREDMDQLLNELALDEKRFAKYFDHTNLYESSSITDIMRTFNEAKLYGFKSVCVYPEYVKFAADYLKNTDVLVCSVIDFPLGESGIHDKMKEAEEAVSNGAHEIDMVVNIPKVMSNDYRYISQEAKEFLKICKENLVTGKFILESSYIGSVRVGLCASEIRDVAKSLGVPQNRMYLKTSTGMKPDEIGGKYGALYADVELLKRMGAPYSVKASGGINDLETALKMISFGADRIGASKSPKIMDEFMDYIGK